MFDPYVVEAGTKVDTHQLNKFQLEDAIRKLGRRNLTLRQDGNGRGTIIWK